MTRFREAIVSDGPGGESAGERLGADLYQRLFGSLSPADAAKTSWLLSLDGALFELPFGALVTGYQNGQPVYAACEAVNVSANVAGKAHDLTASVVGTTQR